MATTGGPEQPGDGRARAKADKAYAKAMRPWWKKKRWILSLGFVLLAMIAAASGGGGDSDTAAEVSGGGSTQEAENGGEGGDEASGDCGSRATEDCTPTVGPNESVRVDALIWSIEGARTTTTIGDQDYGLGEKADDVFLIVNVKVRSDKDESVTLSDESIKLEGSNGNTYSADSEGTIAAVGAGEDPLFLEEIGPDQTTESRVVFDVPRSVLRSGAKLRFNELGFGSTHGYIELPSVSSSR